MLNTALRGEFQLDPAITAVSEYLREIGIYNRAELMRIVDVAMNAKSIYKVALPGPSSGPRGSPNTLVRSFRRHAGWSLGNQTALFDYCSASSYLNTIQAKRLDVERDIKPVEAVLLKYGLQKDQLKQVKRCSFVLSSIRLSLTMLPYAGHYGASTCFVLWG